MKKEIDSLSDRLAELQIQRSAIIAELEDVEQQIATIIEDKQSSEVKNTPKTQRDDNATAMIDRNGKFISKGDVVKPLTSGRYKGQRVKVIEIDDNKISHEDPNVVTEVIELMKSHFGDLTVTRGNKHRFLGMNITLHPKQKIEIEMKDQLQEAIDMFGQNEGDKVTEGVTSPATRQLREVNPKCEALSEEKKEAFHSIVAKLLWIMKRARPDLETVISYLCTRVDKSDVDDWGKLRRVIAYVHCTINDVRIIGANDLKSIFTRIDAAYAVNADMRSQTGGAISLGLGVLHAKCSKQK